MSSIGDFESEEMDSTYQKQNLDELEKKPYKMKKMESNLSNLEDNDDDLLNSEINEDISDLTDEDLEPTNQG